MPTETDVVELSTPLPLPCGQTLPNRVMKAALSEGLGTAEHAPDTRLETLYRRWGAGGYGLVVTGNVMVDRSHLGEPGNVVIEDDRDHDALARWAKSTSDGGVPIWVQLNHPGRQANPIVTRATPVAPSAIASGVPGLPTPRALSENEIRDIIDRFALAASVAEAAGFDGVQLHGAHGYLVSQFLSPLSNRREDAWGGDLDGRMRFVLHVVRAIRAAVSPGFAVGIKLNSADFQRGGFSEEESRITVEHLVEEAIDLIEISGGSYESPAMMGTSSTRDREAYFLEYAHTVRDAAESVPLAVTGGFRTRSVMSAAVRSGECDVVGLGRPTALAPAVARSLVDGSLDRVETPLVALRVPSKAGAFKQINGALDLQWHTDQLQLIGDGKQPDSGRPAWRTAIAMVQRNGWDAFRSRRAGGTTTASAAAAKFRRERWIGKHIANPLVNGLASVGVRTSLVTDIETVGRRSGLRRQVPVSASFDRAGAWVISQHGTRSGWGANIGDEPHIRIRVGDRWRAGTATFVPEDDVSARARSFSANPLFGRLIGAGFRALQTDPISVRIDFTD
ncbi:MULTISPECIES: nitroreductase/quinone reductase family protein [unclassified Rhodococcus (in: high G+C Gram-positive bacteria)]|uniref:nitroreductase/quinone reductase family protein n=1 Tax=unclassified Rhodococcus (in: high G+C Gram-positive bacteria) TaxID=192944 RepID=UPI0019D0580F|nr:MULTISPECIES: nitroreductase/quinone reductase family protein [unclassified Rhodococcus (in: high G+C Gram-positive bacteria)]MBJ7322055.1 nitroreductase family deazaflavin-dependent oxidoreductase [Rhodococcus sp. (in: high G+C Gram-positive bacteria)]